MRLQSVALSYVMSFSQTQKKMPYRDCCKENRTVQQIIFEFLRMIFFFILHFIYFPCLMKQRDCSECCSQVFIYDKFTSTIPLMFVSLLLCPKLILLFSEPEVKLQGKSSFFHFQNTKYIVHFFMLLRKCVLFSTTLTFSHQKISNFLYVCFDPNGFDTKCLPFCKESQLFSLSFLNFGLFFLFYFLS